MLANRFCKNESEIDESITEERPVCTRRCENYLCTGTYKVFRAWRSYLSPVAASSNLESAIFLGENTEMSHEIRRDLFQLSTLNNVIITNSQTNKSARKSIEVKFLFVCFHLWNSVLEKFVNCNLPILRKIY